jgi:hemoglobin
VRYARFSSRGIVSELPLIQARSTPSNRLKCPPCRNRKVNAIAAVSENLVGRLMADQRLGRFWAHHGEDGLKRELQLLVNFLCNVTGGPMVYTGRDMKTTHKGMRIDEQDWNAFVGHVNATLDHFGLTGEDREAIVSFVESTKGDIVEA